MRPAPRVAPAALLPSPRVAPAFPLDALFASPALAAWLVASTLGGLLSLATPALAEESKAPDEAQVKSTMRQLVEPLRFALPLSLSEERFADPAQRDALEQALADLARSAGTLEEHAARREASFDFLSSSLARDAEEVYQRFEDGRLEEARFLLGELANDCIGCHSRLPGAGDSDLGRSLFRAVDAEALSPFETLRLQLMTRQFASALAGAEALLASPDQDPTRLDLEAVPEELLLLAVRLERDPERARRALEGFAARPDTPIYLRETAAEWSRALRALENRPDTGDLLARARAAAERGQAKTRYPSDRAGAVDDLHASSLLHRFLEAREGEATQGEAPSGAARAEAYYLLGVIEMRRSEAFWPSEADVYLEQAIRTAPGTELARRAYAVLEEQYAGLGSIHLPQDLALWLRELRALAVPSAAPPADPMPAPSL